jgi:hypothetical protein
MTARLHQPADEADVGRLAVVSAPAGYVDLGELADLPPLPADVQLSAAFILETHLRADGFVPGLPATVGEWAAGIDRCVVRAMKCPTCRKRGCEYHPFHHPRGGVYKVLAVCPRCRWAEEV